MLLYFRRSLELSWKADGKKERFEMRKWKSAALGATAIAGVLFASLPPAEADTYKLSVDHCTGGCFDGTSPFGTVMATQDGSNVDVTVKLTDNYVFQKSTAFDAFGFNMAGLQTITNLTAGFTYDSDGYSADGFGMFQDGFIKASTGGQSLSFTILNATVGQFALSTIPPGDTRAYFAADILSPNYKTGNVGAITSVPGVASVPGPVVGAGLPGLMAACGGLLVLARRRRQRIAA